LALAAQAVPSLQLTVVEDPMFQRIFPMLQVIVQSQPGLSAVLCVQVFVPNTGVSKASGEQAGAEIQNIH
jgi:hypothetical protein